MDQQAFLVALNTMGEFFTDELSEVRQQTYWVLFRDRCSLVEWHYACSQAMARETFHKVPLPAQLMDYVRELRRAAREAHAQPLAGEGMSRGLLLELREAQVSPEEVQALIASVWPEEAHTPKAARLPTDRHLNEEELHYEPMVDADEAKRRAREHYQYLIKEEGDASHE